MAVYDRKVASEAVKLAYPKFQITPALLVHVIPGTKFMSPEVHELKYFVIDQNERKQIRDDVPVYIVVILPRPLAQRKTGMVWGMLTKDKLTWALQNKKPITPRMCIAPGTVITRPVVATSRQEIPRGSAKWMLNTSEPAPPECTQSFMMQAVLSRIDNWRAAHNRTDAPVSLKGEKSDSFFLVNDINVLNEAESFRFILTVVATANRLQYPEWAELADIFVRLELDLLRQRLSSSFRDDASLFHLYHIACGERGRGQWDISRVEYKTLSGLILDEFVGKEGFGILPSIKNWLNAHYPPDAVCLAVPFEQCLDLVRRRAVKLHKGTAFVPVSAIPPTIVEFTRERIHKCLAQGIQETKQQRGRLGPWSDPRCNELVGVIWRALRQFKPGGNAVMQKDAKIHSAYDYVVFMDTRAPPCMRALVQRHVPYAGRKAFMNFASRMGIPKRLVMAKWRQPFQAHWGPNRSFDSQWKGIQAEYEWMESKQSRKRVHCFQMTQEGLCPFMNNQKVSCLTREAHAQCSKAQNLTGDSHLALYPVMRVKPLA